MNIIIILIIFIDSFSYNRFYKIDIRGPILEIHPAKSIAVGGILVAPDVPHITTAKRFIFTHATASLAILQTR